MSYDRAYDQVNTPPSYQYGHPGTTTDQIAAYTPQPAAGSAQQPNTENPASDQQNVNMFSEGDAVNVSVAHLNLDFKACFHEHESTKTIAVYYKVLDYTYKYVKLFIYHFFVFIFGIFLAIFFALINGTMSFIHVWIFGPALRVTLLWVYAAAPLFTAPLRAIFTPLVDVQARIFRQIRVQANLSGPIPDHLLRQRSNV